MATQAASFALILLLYICTRQSVQCNDALKVVYAVNAGGQEHVDSNGILYEADPLEIGVASDFGNNLLMIGRVSEKDETLYRTERYHTSTFGYQFHTDGDGDYALILKFCEVYFREPQRKIFDVVLNGKHTVIPQLDIFREVGHGTAHEEIVYFKIKDGRLHYKSESSDVRNGRLSIDFIKGSYDNPKINAFALLKGDTTKVPRLPALYEDDGEEQRQRVNRQQKQQQQQQQHKTVPKEKLKQQQQQLQDFDVDDDVLDDENDYEEDELLDEAQQQQQQQHHHLHRTDDKRQSTTSRKVSGPRQPNPYKVDDTTALLPVLIAIGAFIPLSFCLCKL